MIKLISLLFTFAFCLTATGCDEDSTTTIQVQPQPEKRVVFDLPEGWEWAGGDARSGDAIYWYDHEDPKGFYKIGDFTFEAGDQALAEANALEGFNSAFDGRSCNKIPCTWTNDHLNYENSATMEFKTINGQTIIVATNYMDQSDYKFWGHGLNFEKDGIVYNGAIYGAEFDNFNDELATILDSIRVE
ncbi:MAG: hypothetical protein R3B71_04015 [Candidatus Gracilibacteria bacterium]